MASLAEWLDIHSQLVHEDFHNPFSILRKIDTDTGEATLSKYFLSSIVSKESKELPFEEQILSYGLVPFSERAWFDGVYKIMSLHKML